MTILDGITCYSSAAASPASLATATYMSHVGDGHCHCRVNSNQAANRQIYSECETPIIVSATSPNGYVPWTPCTRGSTASPLHAGIPSQARALGAHYCTPEFPAFGLVAGLPRWGKPVRLAWGRSAKVSGSGAAWRWLLREFSSDLTPPSLTVLHLRRGYTVEPRLASHPANKTTFLLAGTPSVAAARRPPSGSRRNAGNTLSTCKLYLLLRRLTSTYCPNYTLPELHTVTCRYVRL